MADFLERQRTLDSYWRAVILFGKNVASYKFALAKSLIELSAEGQSFVKLEELAIPFSKHIVEHLRSAPKQATSSSSRFLEACRKSSVGEINADELTSQTVSLGFNNVIDAFHIVNRAEIPVRFFLDERGSGNAGIRLTDELFRLRKQIQFGNLPLEVEARWRLGTGIAVEDHAMQSAAFQGGASCIKDSAAFSFDEPQHLQTSPL